MRRLRHGTRTSGPTARTAALLRLLAGRVSGLHGHDRKTADALRRPTALRARSRAGPLQSGYGAGQMETQRVIVPSVSPTYYRANRASPSSAYLALFEGIERLHASDMQQMNVPTLVFMDERDELVSYSGVKSIVNGLSSWRLYTVHKSEPAAGCVFHHLVIGKCSCRPRDRGAISASELRDLCASNASLRSESSGVENLKSNESSIVRRAVCHTITRKHFAVQDDTYGGTRHERS